MRNIFIKDKYLSLILNGQKTQTIRKWKQCFLMPGEKFLFNFQYQAEVMKVEKKTISELTDEEIRQDGFKTRKEFISDLTNIYGKLEYDDKIFVITFKLI